MELYYAAHFENASATFKKYYLQVKMAVALGEEKQGDHTDQLFSYCTIM